jgi:long-chain acyl-CoA synthetase
MVYTNNCTEQTLCRGIAFHARKRGHAHALCLGDETVSFGELFDRANQISNGLNSISAAVGDRIALIGKDTISGYELLFGCSLAGNVLVPINWRLTGRELADIVADAQAKIFFLDSSSLEKIRLAAPELVAESTIVMLEDFKRWREQFFVDCVTKHRANSETPIVQIYTSGTTGLPKGVVLAQRTFFHLFDGMRQVGDDWMGLSEQDRLLLSLPQFHIGGLWWAVQGLMAGSCGVMMDSFVGWKALELIQRHQLTKVAMVPAMLQFVMAEPDFATVDLTSVTGFLYGGSPISPTLLEQAMDRFRCEFFQIYGLTETGNTAVCLRPLDHANKQLWSAAGRPYHGVEIRIVDHVSNVTLPAREIGEIWIKTPSAMLEYWNNPEATAETLVDGWVRTGDAGYLDEDGYLFVCDRLKDMIIYAGEKVYPAEIESILLSHPAIRDAAVIGIPDGQLGERVHALITTQPGYEKPKSRELLLHCRGKLADFKIPKSFEYVESIPRNPSGKILKHVLRKPHWENLQRQVN